MPAAPRAPDTADLTLIHEGPGPTLGGPPKTVGDLAHMAGLTASSITGVVDRLEQVGYVKRQPDANDRRKVVVTPLPATEAVAMFEPLRRRLAKLNDRYSTAELALLAGYLGQPHCSCRIMPPFCGHLPVTEVEAHLVTP